MAGMALRPGTVLDGEAAIWREERLDFGAAQSRAACLADPATHPAPVQESAGIHDRFGQVLARCWGRMHPKPDRRGSWANHEGELPLVEGTLVHLAVEYLPGNRDPKPLWLWHSDPDATAHDVDRLWRIFLRRFDIEHTFRFFKQTLGLTRPRLRNPEQADRWAWLILAAYAQLRLARPLAEDLRRSWEKPPDAGPTHPRPCPPRLSPYSADPGHSSQHAESHPPRARPPQGPHLHPRTPPPSRQETTQSGQAPTRRSPGGGLKIKLS